ncbi:MAG: hypothetical protein R3E84_04720 [Pseudomonadales bacterium]
MVRVRARRLRAGRQTSLRPRLLRACHRDPGRGIRRVLRRPPARLPPRTGKLLWDFNTHDEFNSVSGDTRGGSLESAGPLVQAGHVIVNSGYLFGDRMGGTRCWCLRRSVAR